MLNGRTLAALAVVGLLLPFSSAWAMQHHKRHVPRSKTAPPPASVSNAPSLPSVPAREAAVPPEVSYENGQLLINAKNSTLGDVLHAVEKHTGATFDIGSGDTSERVVGRLGPGSARDVLADLLNGSHFNYVMLSPAGDPSALSRVVLTARGAVATQPYAPPENQVQQVQQFQQPIQISPALQVQQQNASADESADNGDTDDNADAEADAAESDAAQPDQQVQQSPQQGVKTPEQLLQELRQQQVIQQQQQLHQPGQIPPDNSNQ